MLSIELSYIFIDTKKNYLCNVLHHSNNIINTAQYIINKMQRCKDKAATIQQLKLYTITVHLIKKRTNVYAKNKSVR